MESGSQALDRSARNNKLLGLALLCLFGQVLVALGLEYSFHDYLKLLLLAANLWMFLAGSIVTSSPESHVYSSINIISIASTFVFYIKPMYILHERTDSYPLVTHAALLFLTAFNALFYAAYVGFKRRLQRTQQPAMRSPASIRSRRVLIWVLWLSWAAGALAFAANALRFGGVSSMLLQNTYVERTLANTEASAGEQIQNALAAACFVAPVALYDYYRNVPGHEWLRRAFLCLVILCIPGALLLLGSRRYTLAVAFALALILWRNPPRWARVTALITALLSPFVFSYWAALRALPLADIDYQVLLERRDDVLRIMFDSPELSMFDEFLKVFRDIGDSLPVRWGADYYKMFLVPIPRTVMPDKPLASGTEFLNHYYPQWFDSTGGAVTISTPGELLWNLWYFGVLGAVLYGLLFAYLDERWLRSKNEVKRCLFLLGGFVVAFGFVRGGHHLVLMEFAKLAWPALVAAILCVFLGRLMPEKT